MAHHLIHPALAQRLRAAVRRTVALVHPDDETLMLDLPPVTRCGITSACLGNTCREGRSQCRTPEQCYRSTHSEPERIGTDAVDAVVIVVCTAVLGAWGAASLVGADWADALRVLASFTGA